MAAKNIYRGFSSVRVKSGRSVVRTGVDLIKADLLNRFYTVPGENRMRPLFGCRLRQKIMEQFGSTDRNEIINEVMLVVQSDPRVTYKSTKITDFPYGLSIAVDLIDKDTGTPFTLQATFSQRSDALYGFSGS